MTTPLEITLSREAVIPARLLWPDAEPIAYEVNELTEQLPERHVSLFQADAAAVRGVKQLDDGTKIAALVVIHPPLSHESDEQLIALAKPNLEQAIEAFNG